MKRKHLVFFTIIAISFIVSLASLFSQSIRLDESQSIWVATKSVPSILQIDAQDVHVPLYTLILHFWMQILGTEIIVVRLLSLIFFVGTLFLLYTLSLEASNEDVALLTVTLFSLSPFIMWYSSEARMYSLFTFITCANHLYFLRMLRTGTGHYKLPYFISVIFGLYTHYFFLFFLASQAIYATISFVKGSYMPGATIWTWISQSRFMTKYYFMLIGALLFLVPWIIFVFRMGSASNTQPLQVGS